MLVVVSIFPRTSIRPRCRRPSNQRPPPQSLHLTLLWLPKIRTSETRVPTLHSITLQPHLKLSCRSSCSRTIQARTERSLRWVNLSKRKVDILEDLVVLRPAQTMVTTLNVEVSTTRMLKVPTSRTDRSLRTMSPPRVAYNRRLRPTSCQGNRISTSDKDSLVVPSQV